MNKNVLELEKQECAKILRKTFSIMSSNGFSKKYRHIYFAGDNNFVCDYLINAVNTVNSELKVYSDVSYIETGIEREYRKHTIQGIDTVTMQEFTASNGKNIVLYFVNCIDGLEYKEQTISSLNTIFDIMKNQKNVKCLISVLLPQIPNFPKEVKALSEREFSFYIEKICDRTPQMEYYIELEKVCRHAVSKNGLDVSILRFDNVFAPDFMHTPDFDINSQINECIKNHHIDITEADAKHTATITYVRAACHAIFASLFRIKSGHVYNVAGEEATMYKIKNLIQAYSPTTYSMTVNLPANINYTYSSLACLKFIKTGVKLQKQLNIGINQLLEYLTTEYDEEV